MSTESKSLESLYLKGDYKELKDNFLKNKDQYSAGIFHYNLGTVFAKEGNFAASRYHLEKAVKEGLLTPNLFSNLSFVKSKLSWSESEAAPAIIEWALLLPAKAYISMSLGLLLVALLLIRPFKAARRWWVLFLALSLLPVAIKWMAVDGHYMGIALKELKIHEGPSQIYEEKSLVPEGAKFVVSKEHDGWFFIEYPLHLTGWISKENIGLY